MLCAHAIVKGSEKEAEVRGVFSKKDLLFEE